MDDNTKLMKRLKYARILLEVKATIKKHKMVRGNDKECTIYNQRLNMNYNCFGHTNMQCDVTVIEIQKEQREQTK